MASYRLPRCEDLVVKPSSCPKCKHRLGFWDLIPVFTWLVNGGKCRHCKSPISFRYPMIELVMGILFAIIYLKFAFSLQAFALFALALCLVVMSVVDLEHKIIPDSIHIALIPIGILYRYSINSDFLSYFSGVILGLCIALALRYGFWLWRKKEGLGMGDVKFFVVAGLFLGVHGFIPFMLFSGVFGVITGLIWKRTIKEDEYPFAPSLASSLFLCAFAPEYVAYLLHFS